MIIRKMNADELDVVRRQRIESYKEYKNGIPEAHWEGLEGTLLSENDLKEGVEIFVAELASNIVGSVVLFPPFIEAYEWEIDEQHYPEIRMLAVNSSYRGKGIAKKLLLHCIDVSKEKGHLTIGLHSADFMKSAISLYTKEGFIKVPELDFEPMGDGIMVRGFKLNLNN